ncbi:hypothetical protein L208DRAFT_1281930 [Tricholoma matsutake]|nr:hypothetical protein L208DRAFT_1281930 [Tricholoma matsutake 945]
MDIEALLNPPEESQMMEAMTDEEICQAVRAARDAQEEGPINGGGNNVEDDVPPESCPAYCEVFQAASIINRYVECVDDLIMHKLEAILASFGHQMWLERSRALATTHITDYFHHI